MSRCALNPQTMDGGKYDYKPAKKQKKIAIIGGGVGGMESAIVLTKRGHKVTIYEKSDKLGGVFIAAAAPSFKEKDKMLIEWYRRQIKILNIEVKLNTEITDLKTLDADEIIVATGSKAKKLPITGIENCIEAVEYLNGKEVGKNVVIIGGGLTGCEVAYDLYLKGNKPVIVEARNDLMISNGLSLANSSYLRDFFKTNKVPVYLESSVKEIQKNKVLITEKTGDEKAIKADSVILSVGYNPAPISKGSKHVHVVGDAYTVGNLRTVIWRAWDICTKL